MICACKKDSPQNSIVGNWAWYFTSYGNPIYNRTPQNTGYTQVLQFTPNSRYFLLQNNTVVDEGTYSLLYSLGSNNKLVTSIFYSNQRTSDSIAYYLIKNDTLIFSSELIGAYGGVYTAYARK